MLIRSFFVKALSAIAFVAVVGLVAAAMDSPAIAQVINGESIYEDNFVHTPPRQDSTHETNVDTTKTHRPVDDTMTKRERK